MQLVERRPRRPEAVAEAAAARGRRASLLGPTGRALLYPPDDDVAAAVDRAVGLLAGSAHGVGR